MRDEGKTKGQLISELNKLRQFIGEHFNIPKDTRDDDFNSLREASQRTKISQEMFKKAFVQSSTPMGVTTQEDGRFIEVSDAFLMLMGVKRDEAIGNTSIGLGLITEEQRLIVFDEFKKKGKVEDLELQVRQKNGNLIHGLFNIVLISFGKEKYLLTVMIDITERKQTEKMLMESERKYREVVENLNEGIWVIDQEAVTTFVNSKMSEILGYSKSEMLGRHLFSFMDKQEIEKCKRYLEHRHQGVHEVHEFEFLRKDGAHVITQLTTGPITDENGDYIGAIAGAVDITDRKRLEVELKESEGRFRRLAENAKDLIYRMSLPEGKYEYLSPAVFTITGYTPEEHYQEPLLIRKMIHPDSADYFEREWHNLLKGDMSPFYEFKIIDKYGETKWINQRNTLIRDINGSPVAIEGIATDITDRKEMEKESREMLSFLHTLFNTIPSPIFCKDVNGLYVDCNKEFEKYTGFERKDIIGKSVYDMYSKDIADKYHEMDLALLRHPGRQIYEYPIVYADGNRHDVVVNKATYQNADGTVAGLVGVMVDITEQKRIEKDLLASQEKYSFLIRNTSDYVARYSLSGNLLFASDGMQFMLGYNPQEVIGTSGLDRVHPDDRSIVQEALKKALETAQGTDDKIEYRTICHDGSYLWVELSGKTVWNNQTGEMEIIATIRNINDRKQAEVELTKYRERLEQLVKERTQDLENKTKALEEINIALKVLLQHREEDKKDLEDRFVTNIQNLIIPFAEKMKNTNLDERQLAYLGIIESHLKDITSSMITKFNQLNLTPTEVEIASLIKEGKSTKEIAKIMGTATSSIDTHRNNIRKKLGISKENVNLRSYLQSFN
jgi:PAS domain S-box-containing protein